MNGSRTLLGKYSKAVKQKRTNFLNRRLVNWSVAAKRVNSLVRTSRENRESWDSRKKRAASMAGIARRDDNRLWAMPSYNPPIDYQLYVGSGRKRVHN